MKKRLERSERGIVLVWSALFMMGLMSVMALAIDVGNWYLQADKLQRAVDSAALAGAGKMPNNTDAIAAANEALSKNKIAGPQVTVQTTPQGKTRMYVKVRLDGVKTIFASWVIDHISLTRSAQAETRSPLAMGNPGNVLGSGTLNFTSGFAQSGNYWLAVNGYCTSAEDGDPLSSRFDGNKINNKTVCAQGAGAELNPNYNWNGYDYLVKIPQSAPPQTLSVFDPGYAAGRTGRFGMSPDNSAALSGDAAVRMTTSYTLFDSTNSSSPSDDITLFHADYSSSALPACAVADWCDLGPTLIPGHTYRLNVHSLEGEQNSLGVNAFSMMVHTVGTQEATSACDSRVSTTCPELYAGNALSMFVNVDSTQRSVDLFITKIDAGYAGQDLIVSLWDPGEGGDNVQLLAPDDTARTFKWEAVPTAPSLAGGTTKKLDVSTGDPAPRPNRLGLGRFNDRAVVLQTQVPVNYKTMVGADGAGWWKVAYGTLAGSPPHDRTTWSAIVADDSPVRLIQ